MPEQPAVEYHRSSSWYSNEEIEETIKNHLHEHFDKIAKDVSEEFKTFDSEYARDVLRQRLNEISTINDIWPLFNQEGIQKMPEPVYDDFSTRVCNMLRVIKDSLQEQLDSSAPFSWPL